MSWADRLAELRKLMGRGSSHTLTPEVVHSVRLSIKGTDLSGWNPTITLNVEVNFPDDCTRLRKKRTNFWTSRI